MNKISLVGVEDGSFDAFDRESNDKTLLSMVQMYESVITGLELRYVKVDGLDATEKLLNMLTGINSKAILLGGVSFAGFNVIDAKLVNNETGIPLIVFSGKKPNMASVKDALIRHFPDWRERLRIIESLGNIYSATIKKWSQPIYFEAIGISPENALEILNMSIIVSRVPEPIRVAGLIAKGLFRAG